MVKRRFILLAVICWTFALRGMAQEPAPSTRTQPKPGDETRQQRGPNNRPSFDSSMQPDGTLDLRRGGNRLVITSDGTSDQDVIQQVKRDRVTRAEPWLLAGDISKGGHLEFKLGSGPSSWAKNPTPPTRPDK